MELLEHRLAWFIMGTKKASVLMTDAYKFSMAQAGFPLREETFVLSLRKGGPFYIPFDLRDTLMAFRPATPSVKEAAFLTANGYGMTPAMEKALSEPLDIICPPKGTWIPSGTPLATITGPSFLVSWLEPLAIMLNYPVQIGTAMKEGVREFTATCKDEAEIIRIVAAMVGVTDFKIHMDPDYDLRVDHTVWSVHLALKGYCDRAFEVGLRAATCMEQHAKVLGFCKTHGIQKTSNVYGAWKLYMIPVGTTGHEHQMRWGHDDRIGYRAIRDMRPEPPSFLFDTTNPMRGIDGAFEVMAEDWRPASMRFDSGDQDAQLRKIVDLAGTGENPMPNLIFEDSYTAEKTTANEILCDSLGWPIAKRMYGYGGFFVSQPHKTPYNRDVVSAAYKLSKTAGRAVRKLGGSVGKRSIPGVPVLYVPKTPSEEMGSVYMIAQDREEVPGFRPLLAIEKDMKKPNEIKVIQSPATQALVADLEKLEAEWA